MSRVIDKNKSFLSLFLSTSQAQQRRLLETITEEQAQLLSEIAFNLLRINLDVDDRKFLKSRVPLLQLLSNKKSSDKYKIKIIKENRIPVTRILIHFKTQLEELLA